MVSLRCEIPDWLNSEKHSKSERLQVTPGVSQAAPIKKYRMFPVPDVQMLKIPLLHSLLCVRSEVFEITFDDDDEETDDNDIANTILENICTS